MSHEQSHLLLPADSAWLALERPENPMTITVMLRVDGLTAPRFREFLRVLDGLGAFPVHAGQALACLVVGARPHV